MVKNVNVTAKYPVYNVLKTPIIGKLANIRLADNQIYACLAGNAKVEEILEDGSTLLLNAHNYNKVNTPKVTVDKKKEEELAKAAEAKRLAEEAAKKAEEEKARKLAEEEAARKAAEEKRKAEEAKRLAEKEAAEKAQKEAQEKAEAEKKASEETADKEDTTSKNNNTNKGKK